MNENPLDIILNGGKIEVYSGPIPNNPNDKPQGELLMFWGGEEIFIPKHGEYYE